VNLIGEHTDYTGGYVLPCLLPYKTIISIAENKISNEFSVYSELFDEKVHFSDFIKSKDNHWIDYIKGCLFVFFDENKQLEIVYLNFLVKSSIPIGRGISSSSALCVAFLKTLNDYFNIGYSDKQIAILSHKVECDYVGVSGGIMDQMISSVGIHGKAFFLDCLTLEYELIDLPNGHCFELVDSKVQRDNRNSAYNERYNQLKKAEKILNVDNLGSVKIDQLDKDLFNDNLIYRRALHVVTENKRTIDAKNLMINNEMNQFGNLMNLSHSSYSRDFEASTPDVDLLVQRSIESGALGCRLTGGGFGGFTVSLIDKKYYDNWYNKMCIFYAEEKFLKICT
jgi:galactokinase